ncbi:MAG TPA: hypothetical protein VHU40_20485 [Polyangia bacterium]|nr:hypothetical protein [Polyangia bacterium]
MLATGGPARANRNDLSLANLCDSSGGGGCPWVARTPTSTTVTLDPGAPSRFRSLMSELGVVTAPRLQTPADTIGFAGFQFSAELGTTEISRGQTFWNGLEGVQPSNPGATRPSASLTTLGGYIRKGMFSPVPSIEFGAGAVNILQSGMWSLSGYVKLALHEGFHSYPLPSIAVRFGLSELVGTDQVSLKVSSLDLLISKAFSLAGTARIEPFVGADLLFIDAKSGVIDATPECDATVLKNTSASDGAAVARLPKVCQPQAGTTADFGGNFKFADQSLILRHRWYGGAKVRLWKFFMVGQVAMAPAGNSVDSKASANAARDGSGSQREASLSAGMDF